MNIVQMQIVVATRLLEILQQHSSFFRCKPTLQIQIIIFVHYLQFSCYLLIEKILTN